MDDMICHYMRHMCFIISSADISRTNEFSFDKQHQIHFPINWLPYPSLRLHEKNMKNKMYLFNFALIGKRVLALRYFSRINSSFDIKYKISAISFDISPHVSLINIAKYSMVQNQIALFRPIRNYVFKDFAYMYVLQMSGYTGFIKVATLIASIIKTICNGW